MVRKTVGVDPTISIISFQHHAAHNSPSALSPEADRQKLGNKSSKNWSVNFQSLCSRDEISGYRRRDHRLSETTSTSELCVK